MNTLKALFSSSSKKSSQKVAKKVAVKKEYSWDKRNNDRDRSNYIVSKQSNALVVKAPGNLAGEQFVIEDCTNCRILAMDHCTSVTIDNCANCVIFIGPCDTSCFVRDCTNCTFVVACQQFRARGVLSSTVNAPLSPPWLSCAPRVVSFANNLLSALTARRPPAPPRHR